MTSIANSAESNGEKSVDPRKLLRALIDLFNEQDLRDLCFELRLDYENLPGLSKKDKARELIIFFDRRRRMNVLVTVFRESRPHISLDEISVAETDEDPTADNIASAPSTLTSTTKDQSNTMLVSKSFVSLLRLMARPDMRTAVVSFQTDFQAASKQIDLMNDYKLIHDLFQELENRYFLIHNDQRRLPADDMAWDSIAINEPELQGKISDLNAVIQRATFAHEEARWMQQLEKVSERVRIGAEDYDLSELKKGTGLLYRVLNRIPSRINAKLVATASALRLDTLEKAMQTISTNLLASNLVLDNMLEEIQNGVGALGGLDDRLSSLVRQHNSWQEIDDELRRVEASLNLGIEELEDAWFDLEPMARDLTAHSDEKWAVSLNNVVSKLDEALQEQVAVTTRRLFRRFQSQIRRRFRQVDLELLTLCQDLQRIGESLDLLLRQFDK
ncbi:MAG: hypothetical protein GY796_28030 [Chloroflexi bacterium]|nr:hypothetical protein [Chloroflexota bacterium]